MSVMSTAKTMTPLLLEVGDDGHVLGRLDVRALAVGDQDDHAVADGPLGEMGRGAGQGVADEGAAPELVGEDVGRDERTREHDGLGVQRQGHPMDEVPGEDRQAESVALAVVQELLERLHGGIETAVPTLGLGTVRLAHAARGIEDDLDVGQLTFDLGRLEGDGVRQEEDRDGQEARRQAIGEEHKATQEPAATAFAAIVGHRQRLAGADPLPERQDDREGQQRQPLGMQEGHGRTTDGAGRRRRMICAISASATPEPGRWSQR
jgi:hypothetical protein